MRNLFKNPGYLVLAFSVVMGLGLRVYDLGVLPSILNRDEAALAYNALLLKDLGVDEWGRSWPFFLESFGDFKLPGYPMILVALFSFLPSNDLVVRIPSAVAGIVLIGACFWLAKLFFQKTTIIEKNKLTTTAGFVGFLIATTPVFWFYSRIAFEANLALAIFVLGMAVLFYGQPPLSKKRFVFDIGAIILFLLAVLTYNTPLLLLPFLLPVLILVRGFKKTRNWILPFMGVSLIFGVFLFILLPLTSQKSGVTIFSDETFWHQSVIYRQELGGISKHLLGNRVVVYSKHLVEKLLLSFSPTFLVTKGGSHPWHSLPGEGHFYWGTYLLGIFAVLAMLTSVVIKTTKSVLTLPVSKKTNHLKKYLQPVFPEIMLLYGLVVTLVPAIITVDAPHATRSLLFFVLFTLASVYGLFLVVKKLKSLLKTELVLMVFLVVASLELVFYSKNYFINYPQHQPSSLGVGFQEVIKRVELDYPNNQIAIVDKGGFQYILTAWYAQIPPEEFLRTVVKQLPDRIGFRYGERVTHFHFIAAPEDRQQEELMIKWDQGQWQVETFK